MSFSKGNTLISLKICCFNKFVTVKSEKNDPKTGMR